MAEGGSSVFLEPLYAPDAKEKLAKEILASTLPKLATALQVRVAEAGKGLELNIPGSGNPYGQFEDRRRTDGSFYPLCAVRGAYTIEASIICTPDLAPTRDS